jgi:vitamin B12 transporter
MRVLVGTSFRLPTAEELYAIDPFELGNPNLNPEKARNANVSIGGSLPLATGGAFNWELIGFFRNVTDLISTETNDEGVDVFLNVPGKVKVRGEQLVLSSALGSLFTARASYTHNSSEDPDGAQISRIPRSVVQAALDFAQPGGRFGASMVANHVGDVASSGVAYGNYTVFDFSARYFLDEARHHRLGARLENAFDREYGRPGTGFRDSDDSPYSVRNVGTPRLLTVSYTYNY